MSEQPPSGGIGTEIGTNVEFAARAVVACRDLITQERVGEAVVDAEEEATSRSRSVPTGCVA
ncbi:hypothetical protein ABZ366_03615 [Streptomyces sp. NPDC005904]|uniref:hypothetical protein n=1 Tax=Streptomyces sp. NPDC005904 TaxID=3154570 RepID=UPI0033EDFEE7